MSIRLAVEADIPAMVDMGVKFHDQSPYKRHLSVNREQMATLGKQLIAKDGLLVSERAGQIIGMIGFVVYPHFLSGEIIAGEVFWWVEPGFRGEGIRLMKEAEDRARAAGAKNMQMIAPSDQVAKVYQHFGYEFVESTYQKKLREPA